jgi:rfaE bifunctional protein nucleotidyltransferase chain/domain
MGNVLTIDELVAERAKLRSLGRRVVFTNGCFDLIHPGHIAYLREARNLGDCLIIALNSDRAVHELKGTQRPILNQDERSTVMSALDMVDYVCIFDDVSPQSTIARILPDVLAKGGDWPIETIIGRKEVQENGGTVVSLPYIDGSSTTDIVDRILSRYNVSLSGGAGL